MWHYSYLVYTCRFIVAIRAILIILQQINFVFLFRFSEKITEQRTEMVSSSSYTETSTKLGIAISHPKSPHGVVRDNFIVSDQCKKTNYDTI